MLFVFDVNETLLDLGVLDETFTALTGSPHARRQWFDLAIHTVLTVTAAGGYRDFFQIASDSVAAVAAAHGREIGPEERRAVLATMRTMPAHPEVPGALARLGAGGVRLFALTNSPLESARAQLANAGLIGSFEAIFSAEQAGVLKPARAPYRMVTDALGVEPSDAVMVAAHGWDVAGARAAGMGTAFVARPGRQPLPGEPAPTWLAPDLAALADQVLTT
jgi:2-haloacid dehalogenase